MNLNSVNMKSRLFVVMVGVFVALSFSSCGYNTLVNQEENVKAKWAQVENAYQRRADLIPNLVNTVKGAANFEQETLTQVIEARAKATSVTVDPENLTPEAIQQFQQSQDALSQSLGRLLVSVERYPELKANQNFLELQAQLEGTENRISTERRAFNEATQEYNSSVRRFPNNITAGMFGFKQKGYFTAEAGANQAPEVQF
ncbi:LemA protein [Parapedobacter luteus]|uniref:LemA protein n=2 Tax=Sphingobacteriaceae TaxID=84566 RepID=A0A1T5D1K6_9SPHI|nr:LemA protein [Parapedobacter luteus]